MPDPIVEIVADGCEPVYDIEVARTENFIANGVVSHNTRWGKRDPIGRALKWAEENTDADPWHEVRFPAVLPSGRSLWPEQWPVEQLLAKKAGMQAQYWAAPYMQEPTAEEGALLNGPSDCFGAQPAPDWGVIGDPDDFSAATDELSHLHWIGLTEARQLDLPFITEVILAEVAARLGGLPQPGVPFFDNSGPEPTFRRLT